MDNLDSVNNNTAKDGDLEFRCPQCYKLYRVNPREIHSSQPHFECQTCHAHFAFDYPPKNNKALYTKLVETKTLSMPQVGKLAKLENQSIRKRGPELKACPKCQTLSPRGVEECYKCGVIFAKAEMMASLDIAENDANMETVVREPKTGALPSLMKMWQELLHDYNNMTKHMAFVDRCEEMHALPFALKKYKELKEVQPQDSLAQQMLNSVLIKSLSRRASKAVDHRFLKFLKNIPYANLARVSPLALGAILVLIGIFSHGSRNFAGGGVAFLVLTLGFTYVSKGRLNWRDFWPH